MKLKFLLLAPIIFLIASCGKEFDLCNQTVTYTKATAIYENTDDLRAEALIEGAREIVDAGKIYVAENYILIGEEGEGIHILDNSNPSNPTPISFLNIPHNREFFVENNSLYASTHYDLVEIDISNIQNPTLKSRAFDVIEEKIVDGSGNALVGFSYETITEKLSCDSPIQAGEINFFSFDNELIPASSIPSSFAGTSGGTIGTVNRIATTDEHIYMINFRDLFIISKGTDLALVDQKKHFDWGMETIYQKEGKLYIGKMNGMTVLTLDNPVNPRIAQSFDHPESCDPVLPFLDVAYVTLRSEGSCPGDINVLDVVDLNGGSQNFFLNEIKQIPMESPYGMTINGNFLFVGEGSNGLKLFDISNTRDPQLVAWDKDAEAYDVIVHPTSNVILTAGPDGLKQYERDGDLNLSFLSTISY